MSKSKYKIGGWEVFEYETIDSTNEEVKRLFAKGNKKYIVVSNHQYKGKGRYSRSWISPAKQGLYASWLLNYSHEMEILPLLVGLTCIHSLRELTKSKIFIKWPNDLIVEGKKLGGVLIETFKGATVVGVGINLFQGNELPPTSISLCQVSKSKGAARSAPTNFEGLRNNILFKLTKKLEDNLTLLCSNNKELILSEVSNYLITPSIKV